MGHRGPDFSKTMSHYINSSGGYRNLFSYQKSVIVQDLTFHFTERFLSVSDRTVDQMNQAARSGKQNIAEGSLASATSKESELKLTNVARASLGELLEDYQDYLRRNKIPQWDKDGSEAVWLRDYLKKVSFEQGHDVVLKIAEKRDAGVVANMAIVVICQAMFLLDRQLERLTADFIQNGGALERFIRAHREQKRRKKDDGK